MPVPLAITSTNRTSEARLALAVAAPARSIVVAIPASGTTGGAGSANIREPPLYVGMVVPLGWRALRGRDPAIDFSCGARGSRPGVVGERGSGPRVTIAFTRR